MSKKHRHTGKTLIPGARRPGKIGNTTPATSIKLNKGEDGKPWTVNLKLNFKEALLLQLNMFYMGDVTEPGVKEELTNIIAFIKQLQDINITLQEDITQGGEVSYHTDRELTAEEVQRYFNSPLVLLAVAKLNNRGEEFLQAVERMGKPGGATPGLMKITQHGVRNILGSGKQLSLFSDTKIETESKPYGIEITNKITELGAGLTDNQQKVMEGILKAFSSTDYKGNIEPRDSREVQKELYPNPKNAIPRDPWRNIDLIPRIKINQSEIFRLSGINTNSIGDCEEAVKSIRHLGGHQYLFYWERLKMKEGKPEIDKQGNYVKEGVYELAPLFRVKTVTHQTTGEFMYYEIEPSLVLLDQLDSYYILIPDNWRQEVKALVGKRKGSSYTYKFLYYLRLKFEEIRRYNANQIHKNKKTYTIRQDWEEVAIAIRMPETVYKRNRARAHKILETCYQTATELGYLTKYTRGQDGTDTLILNESKYYSPKGDN